jgi:hypothetical protein
LSSLRLHPVNEPGIWGLISRCSFPRARFTRAEKRVLQALQALHTRYQQDADVFSRQERAQLLILRTHTREAG